MAANTITGQQILFKIARDVGEIKNAWITTVTSNTTFVCSSLIDSSAGAATLYQNALGRDLNVATTIATVTSYTGSTATFVVSPALSPVVGDRFQFCWWNADKRGMAFDAINEAIRLSWSVWNQQTIIDRSTATITLAAGTHSYALPSGVGTLLRVGVQPTTVDPISWFEPLTVWSVEGQEGALTLRFQPNFASMLPLLPAWTSKIRMNMGIGGTFADAYSGQLLCLEYVVREQPLANESGTTQLPLDYFWEASRIYIEELLTKSPSQQDLIGLNVAIPQIQRNADSAKARLAQMKDRPRQVARIHY